MHDYYAEIRLDGKSRHAIQTTQVHHQTEVVNRYHARKSILYS